MRLVQSSTYQCQVEVRARICNASSCVILRLDSFGYAKHPKDTSVTSGVLIGEQLWILVDGVCPDNLSLDSKSKLSHGLTSDHYWSLLYHCFYLVPICFLLVFWFFFLFGLWKTDGDWGWLTGIDEVRLARPSEHHQGTKVLQREGGKSGSRWGPVNILKSVHEIHWLLDHLYPEYASYLYSGCQGELAHSQMLSSGKEW
jgi:hypothetical protein